MQLGGAVQLLALEMLGLASLVLALFWFRRRIGLTPLYVTLGVFQPVQVLLSSSIYVDLWPGVPVSPGSLMFAASLLAVLLVYIREDAIEARKVIYGILGANFAMTLVMFMTSVQIRTPGTHNFLGIPPGVFSQDARVTAVGTLVFFVDVVLLIVLYTAVRHRFPRRPLLRVVVTLTGVMVFDAFAFTTGAFVERSDFPALLYAASLSKLLIAIGFSAALVFYLRFVEPVEIAGDAEVHPLRDFFYAFTYREKFELQAQKTGEVEARLERAQQVAGMGFLDWNLKTDRIYWSDEMLRLVGLQTGNNLQTLESTVRMVHPDDRAMARKSFDRAIAGGAAHRLDHRMLRVDGSDFWVHAEAELILDEGGSPSRFLGTMVDITERKRAEEQIQRLNEELEARVTQRTRQLESANKELESFSYSVSHDLRAPLRAVSGFSQIIARRHRASLNEEGQRYADNIVIASERMARLIDDLLEYSKLGRKSLKFAPVELNEVIGHVCTDFAQRIEDQHGHLRVAQDLPVVWGDATLLGQVFTNLLENALTYTRPGISANVAVSWEAGVDKVMVHVADQGIGIPAEHLGKIFNVFQRLHGDEDFPGTGIGLAVVQKALNLLGGEVRVDSEVGKGSIFTVTLSTTTMATR